MTPRRIANRKVMPAANRGSEMASISATDGRSFLQMACSMTGMTEDQYRAMMLAGGRSIEGNRYVGEGK